MQLTQGQINHNKRVYVAKTLNYAHLGHTEDCVVVFRENQELKEMVYYKITLSKKTFTHKNQLKIDSPVIDI